MTQIHDYKMLEETVWKFLDLLESQGYCEETQQNFPLIQITSNFQSIQNKSTGLIQHMKKYSRHKSDKKYQTEHVIKDY